MDSSLTIQLPPLTAFATPRRGLAPLAAPSLDAGKMALSAPKFSLAFILDDARPLSPEPAASCAASAVVSRPAATKERKRRRKMTPAEKREARSCCIEGCTNYTIDRGLCFRHGGGKACSVDGCSASAKHRGLCWKHGGSTLCTVAGCSRGAKSRGLCWSHGGGTKCSVEWCQKTTISKGLCWTHGGGKRCAFDGCKRPASQSKQNFCSKHQPAKALLRLSAAPSTPIFDH